MVQQRKSGKRRAACQYLNIIEIRAAHKAKAKAMGWVGGLRGLVGWVGDRSAEWSQIIGWVGGRLVFQIVRNVSSLSSYCSPECFN